MKVSELSTSKYLKQNDVEKPQIVTLTHVEKEDVAIPGQPKKERGVLYFREHDKGLVLNATNIRRLEQFFGGDTDLWVDQKVVLYVDPEVSYGGELVGGLRVRKVPKPGGRTAAAAPKKPNDSDDEAALAEEANSAFADLVDDDVEEFIKQ